MIANVDRYKQTSTMKIFISSTIYDLLDARSEIYEMLKTLGMTPVMSEIPESGFEIFTDKNTIETCLVNLDQSDHVVVILSQRYGASLEKFGFGDFSTTHLEYRRAIEGGKPIHMYVRDRLEADFTVWKKNKKDKSIRCAWVDPESYKLFELLQEHSELTTSRPSGNWYKTYKDSVELKNIIKNDFKIPAASNEIRRLLSRNEFPLLVPSINIDPNTAQTNQQLIFRVTIKNSGGAPAFNYSPAWLGDDFVDGLDKIGEETDEDCKSILAPGETTLMGFIYHLGSGHTGCSRELSINYSNADGFMVTEIHDVSGFLYKTGNNLGVRQGCTLKRRFFLLGSPFAVELQEKTIT